MPARLWPCFILTLAFQPAQAQTQAPAIPAAYDVVSVHEHDPTNGNSMWRTSPDGIAMTNARLQNLAATAFDLKFDLVSGGPPWVDDKGFDISAKLLPGEDGKPVKLTQEQYAPLLLALLKDRFKLQAHIVIKELPIYDLVIAKGGLKMKPSPLPDRNTEAPNTPGKPRGQSFFTYGRFEAHDYPARVFADQLAYLVHQTVIDKTNLIGNYDFTLDYAPDEQLAHPASDNATDPKPDLFTALQEQLGLKLVPTKGPVRTLIIDHAELPTPN